MKTKRKPLSTTLLVSCQKAYLSTFRRCTIAPHCDKEAFNDYSPTHTLALETMQQNRFERFAMISAMTKMAHSI
ncbi:exported hypothetical protein [Vibrio aestuarianus]|nr:exported hypothetical protein [Vibrio aestuarianus]